MSLPSDVQIGFIGGGAMASAIAKGIVRAKLVAASRLHVSDPNASTLTELRTLGMHAHQDNTAVVQACRVIFLATKPDVVVPVLKQLSQSNHLHPSTLLISIAAGLPLSTMESALPAGAKLVRVMPNTPALVGMSASAYALGRACTEEDGQIIQKLLESFGIALRVAEKDLNGVTGLSGSGPAFVFLFIEALADGGVRAGLTRAVAMQLAVQTVIGSAKLVEQTGKHPGQLKDQVASPGGTTIAGIHALERGAFRSTVIDAVYAATNRAKAMGEASNQQQPIKSKL